MKRLMETGSVFAKRLPARKLRRRTSNCQTSAQEPVHFWPEREATGTGTAPVAYADVPIRFVLAAPGLMAISRGV